LLEKSLIHLEPSLIASEERELRLKVRIRAHMDPISSPDIGKIGKEETIFRGKIVFEKV
jgi:hypothetical protein